MYHSFKRFKKIEGVDCCCPAAIHVLPWWYNCAFVPIESHWLSQLTPLNRTIGGQWKGATLPYTRSCSWQTCLQECTVVMVEAHYTVARHKRSSAATTWSLQTVMMLFTRPMAHRVSQQGTEHNRCPFAQHIVRSRIIESSSPMPPTRHVEGRVWLSVTTNNTQDKWCVATTTTVYSSHRVFEQEERTTKVAMILMMAI